MSEEKIEVNKSDLQQVLAENADFKKIIAKLTAGLAEGTGEVKRRPRPSRHREVTVMYLDNKPVVGLKNVGTEQSPVKLYEKPDPRDPKKMIIHADVIVFNQATGKEELYKGINWVEFIREGDARNHRVVKAVGNRWVIDQGQTMLQRVEGDDYSYTAKDIEVPVEINGVEFTYTVESEAGEFDIHEDYVNITKTTTAQKKEYLEQQIIQ